MIERLEQLETSKTFSLLILNSTAKYIKKKALIKDIEQKIFNDESGYGVIYIESYEEWEESLLSDIFEFVLEKKSIKPIGFVIDFSSDPREFAKFLDLNVIQCLFIREFRLAGFSAVVKDILFEIIILPHLPIIDNELFAKLINTQNEAEFMKILKTALLMHLTNRPDARKYLDILHQDPDHVKDSIDPIIQNYIAVKERWLELFYKV